MERSKKEHNNKRRPSSSRLQKHAPPTLHVDAAKANNFNRCAIPLLSPLLLSPAATEVVPAAADAKVGPEKSGGGGGQGWRHPAVGLAMEASNLGALFQAQCMLLDKSE